MAKNKKLNEKFSGLPEEEQKILKQNAELQLDLLREELEKKFGVKLEVVQNETYKWQKFLDFLNDNYEFRFNRVGVEIEFKKKNDEKFVPITDRDENNIYVALKDANQKVAKQTILDTINSDKISKPYHPFEEYLYKLPKWDPDTDLDYIDLFLRQVKLKDESERPVFIRNFTKWFVAMVATLVTDGLSNQQCLVFVGRQGIFKTTFLNNLVPKNMQMDYLFSSKFNFEDKDHVKYLGTKMLINLDELNTFSRTEEGILKSVLTESRVVLRTPYGRHDTKWWRKASFCGSTNNKEFLKDETGNRRFLVFEIDDIVMDKDFNIEDIYAQALYLFKNGFQYWFDYEDIGGIEERNMKFHDVSIEQDLVQVYLARPTDSDMAQNLNFKYETPTDINTYLAGKSNRINVNETTKRRINLILRKLGFKECQKRLNGSSIPTRVWAVKYVQRTEFEGGEPASIDYPPI